MFPLKELWTIYNSLLFRLPVAGAKLIVEDLVKMCSPALHLVVDAYEHAVVGKFPRGRYVVGNDAKFIFWPLSLAPEWLADLVLTRKAPIPRMAQKLS